jgi:archaemetzincin
MPMIPFGLILASACSFAVAHPTTAPRAIALVPLGEAPAAEVGALSPILRATFGVEILVAPAIPLPQDSYDASRRQYRSTAILNVLSRARRPEWERLLGVADVDLFVPELNFVFGEADSRRGVAVFSLARLRTSDEALFARRAATEAIHELGHTWGLSHCADPHCVMWFSNTLSESDRKGTRFCPRHEEELARARGR